jgi:hypothetical protein
MKKNQVSISIIAAATLACPAVSALGNTESFTASFGTVSTPLTVDGTSFPLSLTLPRFDTALGTLTGVGVEVNTTDYLSGRLVNLGAATVFTGAAASGTIGVTGLAGTQSLVTLATTPFSGFLSAGSLFSPTYYLGPAATASGSGSSVIPNSDFGAYEANGGGNLDFVVDASYNGTFSGDAPGGAAFFGGEASVFGTVTVDYNYVASAPEGGSLFSYGVLCFGGLIGCGRSLRVQIARRAALAQDL